MIHCSSVYFFACIASAFFQAKFSAEIITHAITASAKSPLITVIAVTATITIASLNGIFGKSLNVGQAKVPITTINISPTSAASGMIAMKLVAKTIKSIRNTAAETQDIRPLPPFEILIID